MATISAPFDEVLAWLLDTVVVRPGLPELVAAHDPLIISAGFRELIEPVLEREGVVGDGRREPPRAGPAGWRVDLPRAASRARSAASRASASRSPARAVRLRRRRHLRPLRLARGGARVRPRRAGAVPRRAGRAVRALRRPARRPRGARRLSGSCVRSAASPCSRSRSRTTSSRRPSGSAPTAPTARTSWHDGGLHRVIAGREVRLEAAPGGVEVEPFDDDDRARGGLAARRSARPRGASGPGLRPSRRWRRCGSPWRATGRRSSPTRGRCS